MKEYLLLLGVAFCFLMRGRFLLRVVCASQLAYRVWLAADPVDRAFVKVFYGALVVGELVLLWCIWLW